MENNDFDEILKETELDSAKMIFRLTSELKEKELELAALRSKSFEEIQRNNKAKEAEFEALIEAQETRIKKRENEIARLLVEKEAGLWHKHQAMLEDAIARHRAELEEERGRLNMEIARKENEVLEQKKNLRVEMETLFKKWETERENDFKNERKTFLEELKLGRDTARREAEDRAAQMEKLWKEKLEQNTAELSARHDLELEEERGRLRREHLAGVKELNARLNEEFAGKERRIYENYTGWLAENKKLLEDDFSKRLFQTEADYSSRIAGLEDALKKSADELSRRQSDWTARNDALKNSFLEKETALEASARRLEEAGLASEKALAAKYEKLEKELARKAERQRAELDRKEAALEARFDENAAELQEQSGAREKLLAEREAKLAVEREELNRFRNQVADTIRQRETELAGTFEERYALLKESMEESARIKELGLARKHEEVQQQFSILSGQKEAALARGNAIAADNEDLKRLLAEKDACLRSMDEQEQARTAQLRKELEEEFGRRVQAMRAQLAAAEGAARKNLEDRLQAEASRLADQYRIKEDGLAAQRELMNTQAGEMEAKFMEALKAKEAENSLNIRKAIDGLNAQLETARAAHAIELDETRRRAEEAAAAMRAELDVRLGEKEFQHEQLSQAREKQALAAARHEAELETKKAEETHQVRVRDLEGRLHLLEQNLKFALQTRDEGRAQAAGLKEEIERLNLKLEQTEHEKQELIQENLSKARDIRQAVEKEFLEKVESIEKNYLNQLADTVRRGEDGEKTRQDEYYRKLEFIKGEYAAKLAAQLKEIEDAAEDRENRLRSALEESYKLKAKTLATRYEQQERNYEAMIADKAIQLDNDRAVAESVNRLKSELEARNRELNAKILEHDRLLEQAKQNQASALAAARKELEDANRMKTSQLENERAKLKGLLEQEQRLVTDLQKREAALQESYTAKETALMKEFTLARERLESDYKSRLKDPGK